ncbi:hypothetical protein HaLaN_04802, partial [Haematococcus lacustris]
MVLQPRSTTELESERCMVMKQLCMWSDGCAAQFKGTPALQLHRRMAMRYRVSVWWSYGATSHFKGRHDSEGGVFKHNMAARVLADHPDLSAECKAQQLAGVCTGVLGLEGQEVDAEEAIA